MARRRFEGSRIARAISRVALASYNVGVPELPLQPDSVPTRQAAPAIFGQYRTIREIGSGGMATVYLAEDAKHNRLVAIKVMKPAVVQAIGQDRFLREIEIAARLNHPHVVPLFDSGAAGEYLFGKATARRPRAPGARLSRSGAPSAMSRKSRWRSRAPAGRTSSRAKTNARTRPSRSTCACSAPQAMRTGSTAP